jgi:hypothetical protein
LNCNHPDLYLLSRQDYRREPPASGLQFLRKNPDYKKTKETAYTCVHCTERRKITEDIYQGLLRDNLLPTVGPKRQVLFTSGL